MLAALCCRSGFLPMMIKNRTKPLAAWYISMTRHRTAELLRSVSQFAIRRSTLEWKSYA